MAMARSFRTVVLPRRFARARSLLIRRFWPTALREQVRGVFLVAAVVGNALLFTGMTAHHGVAVAAGSSAATIALSVLWLRGYQRRRFSWCSEPVEAGLLLVAGLGEASAAMLLGPIYNGIFYRSLYGGPVRAALRTLGYTAVMEVLLALHPASDHMLRPGALVAWLLPSLAMSTVAVRLLIVALNRREAASERERILAEWAGRLLEAEDEAAVQGLAVEGASSLLRHEPRAIALLVERHGELDVVASRPMLEASELVERAGGDRATIIPLRPSRGAATSLYVESAQPLGLEVRQSLETLAGQLGLGLAGVRLRAELAHRALHDGLTNLANRSQLTASLREALARNEPVGVVFIDLDDFKTVNDALGHEIGDGLLRAVAARLARSQRPGDLLGRLGGDEFAALVFDLHDDEEAAVVGARLLAALDAPFVVDGHELSVRCSLGICVANDGQGADEVLRNADTAMYVAKARGKGRCELYNASMHEAVTSERALRDDLHAAVGRHEFALSYQPLVALSSGEVVGFEALLHWRHPTRGLLRLGEFLPLAERLGVLHEIERQALADACRTAARWPHGAGTGTGLRVHVNLAPSHVAQATAVDDVHRALADAGLDPSRLVIEMSVGASPEDLGRVATTLAALRALGVQVALDDFGSACSSLNLLAQLAVDTVKLDPVFTSDLARGPLVRAVLDLAARLGVRAVAQGVERSEQHRFLLDAGCETGQGRFYSRPVPAEEIAALLDSLPAGGAGRAGTAGALGA